MRYDPVTWRFQALNPCVERTPTGRRRASPGALLVNTALQKQVNFGGENSGELLDVEYPFATWELKQVTPLRIYEQVVPPAGSAPLACCSQRTVD